MNFLPQFELSVTNAFWFSIVFIVTNIIMLKIHPSHYKKRVLSMPKFDNKLHQFVGMMNFLIFQGLIGLMIFVPVQFNFSFFIIGIVIFAIGYVLYVKALFDYATNQPEKPVTKGVYKISRNPQQIFTMVMWIGMGFITFSWLIVLLCLFQLILAYPTFIAQEKYCIQKYGEDYENYMKKAPRYLFW